MTEVENAPPGVDVSRPSSARIYDYLLGGSNNFPADRQAGDWLKAAVRDHEASSAASEGAQIGAGSPGDR